tara:strand:- start:686 stop:877 length:192 start_codon:yes stop_codon:yes gene_type:complete
MFLYFDDSGKLNSTSTSPDCSFEKDGKIYKSPIEYKDYIWGHDYKMEDGEIVDLGEIKEVIPE